MKQPAMFEKANNLFIELCKLVDEDYQLTRNNQNTILHQKTEDRIPLVSMIQNPILFSSFKPDCFIVNKDKVESYGRTWAPNNLIAQEEDKLFNILKSTKFMDCVIRSRGFFGCDNNNAKVSPAEVKLMLRAVIGGFDKEYDDKALAQIEGLIVRTSLARDQRVSNLKLLMDVNKIINTFISDNDSFNYELNHINEAGLAFQVFDPGSDTAYRFTFFCS